MEHENLSFRTGDHLPVGRFYAIGPGITQRIDVGKVSVMDFAPTIAKLLGITHPGSDGKPIATFADAVTARMAEA
jgi:predicted AlkP superfamily phosphohydrolase/phosphomutase